ncbi:hypothetical protein HMPREF1252_0382 [Peptoniphilus sp. BV3AC2]|nr:hypothetical protein HMPREF1252_0382 [Peptoniphilus sp. BV3AC2]
MKGMVECSLYSFDSGGSILFHRFGAVPSGTSKKTKTISINTNASTSIK